jgi:formate-dependent nitrite reductase membrane component NrfD
VSPRRRLIPALGTRGEPGSYERAREGGAVEGFRREFGDAEWSYLYGEDTDYAESTGGADGVAAAARRARSGPLPERVQGSLLKPAVWTWEVPLYFWTGGIAAGSAFVAMACDIAGDERGAATARRVSLVALVPCPALLVADLGRPGRFLHMLRVVKPRSPMSMGAWCLTLFGNLMGAAVAADLTGRRRLARGLGAGAAALGVYLGSYTGVLLGSTAVPVWARSRLLLGPIFAATATATGAAASRLALVATGVPEGHPTSVALGRVETGAIAAELTLSQLNERRLGRIGQALRQGRARELFAVAKGAAGAGLALRLLRRRLGPGSHNVASVLYLGAGLAFRYAWVAAGRDSARDDEAAALTARREGR